MEKTQNAAPAVEHNLYVDANKVKIMCPDAAPVAYEFYNPETGHAIVDYSEHTHVGHLTAEKGYVKKPLIYAAVAKGDPT